MTVSEYARVLTVDHDPATQFPALSRAGVDKDVTGEAHTLTDLHSNGDELVSRHTLAAVFAAVVTGRDLIVLATYSQ